jgi:hypothetical protein
MNAPTPDPSLIACHIDESAGMDPTVPGNGPATVPSGRIPEEARAHLVEFAQHRIQDVWNDVGQTDALTLAQNVVAAQEFLWLSMQFPVHAARPATPSAPATPAVGVRTSEGATGAPGCAGEVGLGDAIRAHGYTYGVATGPLRHLADRADALERDLDAAVQRHLASAENHGAALRTSQERGRAIERVRAQFVRMTKSSDEKTRNHGTALLHILDGDS